MIQFSQKFIFFIGSIGIIQALSFSVKAVELLEPDLVDTKIIHQINEDINKKEWDNADDLVSSNLKTYPNNRTLLFLESRIEIHKKQMEQAITHLQFLIDHYPEWVAPYNNLAVVYATTDQLYLAKVTLEQANKVQPNDATVLENLADVYVALAKKDYAEALKLRPDHLILSQKLQQFHSIN